MLCSDVQGAVENFLFWAGLWCFKSGCSLLLLWPESCSGMQPSEVYLRSRAFSVLLYPGWWCVMAKEPETVHPSPPQLHWRRQSCPPRSSVRHSVSFCKPRIFSQNFYNMCHITPTWPEFNGRVVGDGCSLFKTAHQHLLVWNCWVCLMRHRDIFTLLETQLDVFFYF